MDPQGVLALHWRQKRLSFCKRHDGENGNGDWNGEDLGLVLLHTEPRTLCSNRRGKVGRVDRP